jgi:ABC-2 type transport system ATP-binding protein
MEKETYWSRFADNFEELSTYVVGKTDIDIVLKKLGEQKDLKKTLELGCGSGTYSRVIASEASELHATDFSDEMVNTAQKAMKAFPNVCVEKENCFELSYGNKTFDTVLMANLLHIVPEPEKAIAEAKRVLKTGGSIIIISYTADGMKIVHKLGMIWRYLKAWGRPSPYAQNLNLTIACDMLATYGLEITYSELLGLKSKAIFIRAIKPNRKQE